MAAETGFDIGGTLYEVPTLESFTMDEAQVLYDYSGLTIEDFVEVEDEPDEEKDAREARFKNPGFIRALMHIAYQREHTDVKPAKVKALVGSSNLIAAATSLVASVPEDEESPLASTTGPEKPSESSSVELKESSGDGSTSGSDSPDVPPEPIGTTRSDTSSQGSHLTGLVA